MRLILACPPMLMTCLVSHASVLEHAITILTNPTLYDVNRNGATLHWDVQASKKSRRLEGAAAAVTKHLRGMMMCRTLRPL